jgi:hypothetical protein
MARKKKEKEKKEPVQDAKNSSETQSPDSSDAKKPEEKLEKPPEGQMFIKVYSPFKVYFDSLGASISAANDTGEFDILAGHHKFLTLLSACDVVIRTPTGEGEESIKIDRGIMYVKEDRVTVFLDV